MTMKIKEIFLKKLLENNHVSTNSIFLGTLPIFSASVNCVSHLISNAFHYTLRNFPPSSFLFERNFPTCKKTG